MMVQSDDCCIIQLRSSLSKAVNYCWPVSICAYTGATAAASFSSLPPRDIGLLRSELSLFMITPQL